MGPVQIAYRESIQDSLISQSLDYDKEIFGKKYKGSVSLDISFRISESEQDCFQSIENEITLPQDTDILKLLGDVKKVSISDIKHALKEGIQGGLSVLFLLMC